VGVRRRVEYAVDVLPRMSTRAKLAEQIVVTLFLIDEFPHQGA
jgi:hypothetical protein